MAELRRFQIETARWANWVFGADRPPDGAIAHLLKEVKELADHPHDSMEYADCFMLLLDAASNAGISVDTILDVAWEKLEINRQRKWGEPGPDGVVEHVRDDGRYIRVWIDLWNADNQEYGLRTVGDDGAPLIWVHKDKFKFKKIARGWHGTLDTENMTVQLD